MRRSVCTFIFIGCINFAGFAAHAQSTSSNALESIRQSLSPSNNEGETSLSDRMNEMLGSPAESAPLPEEQPPIIEVPIIPATVEVPEVNQGTAEVIDTRGRYRPRLKVDFATFPLRSLTSSNHTEDGIPVKGKIPLDIIVQRIKDRFRLSHLHLSVKDRAAVISGTADTEHQRNLIATMLRFEPGIDTVQNEIAVTPSLP